MVMFGKKDTEPAVADGLRGAQDAKLAKENFEETRLQSNKGTDAVKPDTSNQKRNSTVGTVIGDDTKIDGKVTSKGTLRIDGEVKGEVKAVDTIIVGPSGKVNANLEAKVITISGKVHGNISAIERLELQPTCEIKGDVQTAEGALVIESGARLEGKCSMGFDKVADKKPALGAKTPTAQVLSADPGVR